MVWRPHDSLELLPCTTICVCCKRSSKGLRSTSAMSCRHNTSPSASLLMSGGRLRLQSRCGCVARNPRPNSDKAHAHRSTFLSVQRCACTGSALISDDRVSVQFSRHCDQDTRKAAPRTSGRTQTQKTPPSSSYVWLWFFQGRHEASYGSALTLLLALLPSAPTCYTPGLGGSRRLSPLSLSPTYGGHHDPEPNG